MIFAALSLDQALGAILAHTIRLGPRKVIKKGTELKHHHIDMLRAASHTSVTVAKFEAGDVAEDEAAGLIAHALIGDNVRATRALTGRCNLIAEKAGVVVFNPERITALNLIDEAITIATLPAYAVAHAGQMVATIKIIPFAVAQAALDEVKNQISKAHALRVSPFQQAAKIGLVLTNTDSGRASLLDKAAEALRLRLENIGCELTHERRCSHDTDAVSAAMTDLKNSGCDPIIICGATATVDRRDVVPAGIVAAGGSIDQYGIPVDPGNLLLLGHLEQARIIVMPGCARSLKLNGFDWVLTRTLANLEINRKDIAALGVGGLLEEMPGRPLSRERAVSVKDTNLQQPGTKKNIAAIVLAAGRSTRMGEINKLLSVVDGKSMLRHAVDAATTSGASSLTVVTGHAAHDIEQELAGLNINLIHNPDFKDGMSTSVQCGIASLPGDVDGVVICLGDMPGIRASHIDALIEAFDPELDRSICVSCSRGKRGNPVLWSGYFFPEIMQLSGDAGARQILRKHGDVIVEVSMDDDAVLQDVDTPQALAHQQGINKQE